MKPTIRSLIARSLLAAAGEEAFLAWSRRFPVGGFNAAQFNYGSNPDFGAVTHWTWPDMGFTFVPPANLWQTIFLSKANQ
jgi:hypothetical protein